MRIFAVQRVITFLGLMYFLLFPNLLLGQDDPAIEITPEATEAETIATPAAVDREFTDTEATQAQREQLVERFIVPFVEDARVLEAMQAVQRHSFIPLELLGEAYQDHPLPIGFGQTISQPSLVAMMTEVLELEEGDKVLEIGTGSGYQAAILRELTDEVYSVEIVPELTSLARAVLDHLGYEDVALQRADGYYGWEEHAPFDAIIVTAAPDHLPRPLVNQLSPDGGRMVIPIGPVGDVQTLWLVVRNGDEIEMQRLLDVRFVPFTRENE
jgi:protein-L-isoaspartate(D-aspartate) O-methyltransferase